MSKCKNSKYHLVMTPPPYIYAKTRRKACAQCRYASNCPSPNAITQILRGRINTYDCVGFCPTDTERESHVSYIPTKET